MQIKNTKIIFNNWLEKNKHKFYHKPIQNADGSFYFVGITKDIRLFVDFIQPEAMLLFEDIQTKEDYDIYSISYIEKYCYDLTKGHFDADRIDKIYTYYSTYKELIISEVFEPILEYCNKYFHKNNALYLVKTTNYTEGFIASQHKKLNSTISQKRIQLWQK